MQTIDTQIVQRHNNIIFQITYLNHIHILFVQIFFIFIFFALIIFTRITCFVSSSGFNLKLEPFGLGLPEIWVSLLSPQSSLSVLTSTLLVFFVSYLLFSVVTQICFERSIINSAELSPSMIFEILIYLMGLLLFGIIVE